MNKTAIKNFAVWARNKLIADISYRAGLMGITESGIASALPQSTGTTEFYDIGTAEPYAISGDAVRQRRRLVELIERKANETDYKTAYKYIIEEVAYTWFNRLIAIRFMEVNDYLPSHIRVLSSESGKIEPDLVTNPFDAEFEFTNDEKLLIMQLKQDNRIDELFRILFIKQCNELNVILPFLFEKTSDYTELLLNLSVVDQEGVVFHLINDIPEEDFDVERGGQVEIIGWLYQYYIAEPKDELINARSKYCKEEIPYVTQLFTTDWIVQYMVENSLGRLWLEGHSDLDLQNKWNYYIELDLENESQQSSLKSIREYNKNIQPEEIKVIDPCMGSGHILVYSFDVLMDIYESAGYNQRDAAKSILENNIYGLDIDDRAYQMAYFAVMMKARQYNRRILNSNIQPHLFSISESKSINRKHLKYFGKNLNDNERKRANEQILSLIKTFADAKELGSLLNVQTHNYELLNRYVNNIQIQEQLDFEYYGIEETQEQLRNLIDVANLLEQQYEVVITNPPYMNSSYMPDKIKEFLNDEYLDFKGDLFAAFTCKILSLTKVNGHIGMLTPYVWMFLSAYEKMRAYVNRVANITSLVQLEYNAFEAACVPVAAFTMCKTNVRFSGEYIKLSDFRGSENQAPKTLEAIKNKECGYRFSANQDKYSAIPGSPMAYWVSENFLDAFSKGISIDTISDFTGSQHKTADNDTYLRMFWEIPANDIVEKKWIFYAKGGEYKKWYGNLNLVVDWRENAKKFYISNKTSNMIKEKYWFKEGITYTSLTSSANGFRYLPPCGVFDIKGPSIIDVKHLNYCLGFFNTSIANRYLKILNSSMTLQVKDVKNAPLIIDENMEPIIDKLVEENIVLTKEEWDSYETSWEFKRHPLAKGNSLRERFSEWEKECNKRFEIVKANEEKINECFIRIYGLDKEIDSAISDKEITLRKADRSNDIKGLLSYAVGCMFGRYSLDVEGIAYASGIWDNSKYTSFIPDADNIIPITDEEYLEDDIVNRLCTWLRAVYGDDSLEDNLQYIAEALDEKGKSSRDIIRNYFLNDFFKDHCSRYSVTGSGKRPIYWLFDSGKQNGFKALIYIHRYTEDTIGNLRIDYLHKMQRVYESENKRMQDLIDHSTNTREIGAATKRKEKLQKQLKECRDYDEKLGHLALARIHLNLDDGIKVNYEKIQIAGDKKKYQILAKF